MENFNTNKFLKKVFSGHLEKNSNVVDKKRESQEKEKAQDKSFEITKIIGKGGNKEDYNVTNELIENIESFKEDVKYNKFINNISYLVENNKIKEMKYLSEKYFEKLFKLYGSEEYSEINDIIKKINLKLIGGGKGFIIHPDLYVTLPGFTIYKYNNVLLNGLGLMSQQKDFIGFEKDENGKIVVMKDKVLERERKLKISLKRYTNVKIKRNDPNYRLDDDRYKHLDSLDVIELQDTKYTNHIFYRDTVDNHIDFKYIYPIDIYSKEYEQMSKEGRDNVWQNKKIDCEKTEQLNPIIKKGELVYPQMYLNNILKELNTLLKKDALKYVNLISIDEPHIIQQEDVIVDNFPNLEEVGKLIKTLSGGYYAKNSKILGVNSLVDKQDSSLSKWKNTIWHEIGHSFHVFGCQEANLNPLIEEFFRLSKQNQSNKDCLSSRSLDSPRSFKRSIKEALEEDFAEMFSYFKRNKTKKNMSNLFYKKSEVMREILSITGF